MAIVNHPEQSPLVYKIDNSIKSSSDSKYNNPRNRAPFNSSRERTTEKLTPIIIPGSNPLGFADVYGKKKFSSQNSSPFTRNKEKFENKFENSIGLDSYEATSRSSAKQKSCKFFNYTNLILSPSPPSIPGQLQRFGYDELLNGELLMHKDPNLIAGTLSDSVGPGHYNPKAFIPNKGASWYKSNTKRITFLSKPSVPGPGAYAPGVLLPRYKLKQSAAFISSVKRNTDLLIEDNLLDGIPGPGRYSLKSTFSPSPIREIFQNFGSSVERFKSTTPTPIHIGPGKYNISSPSIKDKDRESKVPFCSSVLRFKKKFDISPGPGAYINAEIKRNVWGKKGIFSSSEKRFSSKNTENNSKTVGYNITKQINSSNSYKYKGHSVFLSKCKRLKDLPKNNTPSPGSYDIISPLGQVKSPAVPIHPILIRIDDIRKNVGFCAQADRFLEKKSKVPGPGSYKIKEIKKQGLTIVSKDIRFKKINDLVPGPGTYDYSPKSKKQFNVLF